jgi:hypothetical protein
MGLVLMLLIAFAVGLLIGHLVGALLERIGLEPFAFLIHPTPQFGYLLVASMHYLLQCRRTLPAPVSPRRGHLRGPSLPILTGGPRLMYGTPPPDAVHKKPIIPPGRYYRFLAAAP